MPVAELYIVFIELSKFMNNVCIIRVESIMSQAYMAGKYFLCRKKLPDEAVCE